MAGTDERWHVTGARTWSSPGMANQRPSGTVQLGQVLVALKANANGTCTLTFQSGRSTKQVTANSVILALPFVTLRNGDLSRAGLSALKTTAITTMGMGTNAKVIMEFKGAPWIADGYTGTTYQDNGFISSGWQIAESAASGGYAGPTSLGRPSRAATTPRPSSARKGSPTRMINDTLKQALVDDLIPA